MHDPKQLSQFAVDFLTTQGACVVGVATTDDVIRLEAARISARGPLASRSPTHDFIWLTPEGAPSKQYPPLTP